MRLQVESATASWISVGRDQLAQHARGAALGQRDALAQLDRRGLVGDAECEQLAHAVQPRVSIWSGSKRSLHSGVAASSIAACSAGEA